MKKVYNEERRRKRVRVKRDRVAVLRVSRIRVL